MRLIPHILAALLLISVGHAQTAPATRGALPVQARLSTDAQRWRGPLVPMSKPEFFRTFSLGAIAADTPPAGMTGAEMLMGFELSFGRIVGSAEVVTSLQPFYSLRGQRIPGPLVGQQSGARVQLIARDGYAVKSLKLGGQMNLLGMAATFGRIQPDGTLSEVDTYASPTHGPAGDLTLEADGLPFCGIVASAGRGISGFALIVSGTLTARKKPALEPRSLDGSAARSAPPAIPPAVLAPDDELLESAEEIENPRVGAQMKTAASKLYIVEGAEGSGSAFVCMIQGKRYLWTNQHVISGNANAKFTGLAQNEIKVGAVRAAVGHDIMAYEVAEEVPTFEMTMDFADTVTVGDEVVVLGNTEGARVIKPLRGRVLGIGPNLVEVSSKFLPGNSGSPIVHLKSGKVIGIATYAVVRSVNSLTGQKEPSIRRFGYRLDSVTEWQNVNAPLYQAESASTKKVADFSSALMALLRDMQNGRPNPAKHTDPRLRTVLAPFSNAKAIASMNIADRTHLAQNFVAELRSLVQRDVEDLKPKLRYDFFRKQLVEEGKFRAELYKSLSEAMESLR